MKLAFLENPLFFMMKKHFFNFDNAAIFIRFFGAAVNKKNKQPKEIELGVT